MLPLRLDKHAQPSIAVLVFTPKEKTLTLYHQVGTVEL